MTKKIYRNFVAVFGMLCLLLSTTTAVARSDDARSILVVNSYHPTYRWTGLIMNGIESTLKQYKGTITIDVEYMDTRSITDKQHYENLFNLYKHKAGYKQYDVVIASDNNALAFVLRHRDELYQNVPIVFCGISSFQESMIAGYDAVTGVTEERIIKPTVEIALQFHPAAKNIVFVVNSNSSQDKLARVDRAIAELSRESTRPVRFQKRFVSQPILRQFLEAITGLDAESIVIFASAFRDDEMHLYSFKNIAAMVREKCSVPIYALTEQWFGYVPIIGGRINSGFHQGQAAAEMAVRILEGQSTRNIPVLRSGVDRYIFDYVQLKRFGISLSQLPEDSIIINKPYSFYYLYRRRIWTVTAVIFVLTVMVIILSANNLRRRQAEKRLLHYQAKLKSLASELSLTEERERRRIAVELHDRIGQSLVMSKVRLEALRQEPQSFGDTFNTLGDVCNSIGKAIQDTRSLTFDLSYPILYELGFEAAVAECLAEQIEAEHGIATEFEDDGQPKPLEEDIRVLLFRSVREVLINVVKHARAHRVKVFSRRVDGRIHVDVEDDGVGFNLSEVSSIAAETGGFGLFSIRERLEQVGGCLEVASEPGRGTKVMIVAPLKR